MNNQELIRAFLEGKEFAVAGVSRNPKKFGRVVFDQLRQKGFRLIPVNPSANEIDGVPCFSEISGIPENVRKLLVITPTDITAAIIKQAGEKGIQQVWIQQRSDSKEAIELAKKYEMQLITGECIFMYAEPVKGVHKFHRFLKKLFAHG